MGVRRSVAKAFTLLANSASHDAVFKIARTGWIGTGEFFTVSLQ